MGGIKVGVMRGHHDTDDTDDMVTLVRIMCVPLVRVPLVRVRGHDNVEIVWCRVT